MKKIFMLLLSLILVFSLAACGDNGSDNGGSGGDDSENNGTGSNGGSNNTDGGNDNNDNTDGGSGSGESGEVTYTVKVISGGVGVEGATVMLVGDSMQLLTTDSDGTATYTAESAGTYSAILTAVPGVSGLAAETKVFGNNTTLTFEVQIQDGSSDKVTYTIKVVDKDGNPVVGQKVQMCIEGGLCQTQKETDSDGIVTYEAKEDNWKAQLATDGAPYVAFDENRLAVITINED